MSIWGRRDSEPAAGEHQGQAEAHDTQEPAAGNQAQESASASWQAQGEAPPPMERDPADAPLPAHGHVPAGDPLAGASAQDDGQMSGEASAPAVSESPAGTDAPVPVLTGAMLDEEKLDQETAAKDPALTEGDQARAQDAEAAGPTTMTEPQEPDMTGAQEPAMAEAQELAGAEPREPAVTGAEQPAATEAHEPVGTDAREPAVTRAEQPAGATAAAMAVSSADAAAAPVSPGGIPAQRWSEILVAFVDDPRGSVKMAADAVDEAIGEFVSSVRVRQRDLASTWQGAEADTEQLRTALREYRKLGQRVQQLDLGEKTGG